MGVGWRFVFVVATVAALPATADAAARYRLHFAATSCLVGPCPDWKAVDLTTGKSFPAIVVLPRGMREFSWFAKDLVAVANRTHIAGPNPRCCERLTVTRVVGRAPRRLKR